MIASLKSTIDHHTKDLQEIHKFTSIYTRTLNEMSQQLGTILQKLNIAENTEPNPKNSHTSEAHINHSIIPSMLRSMKLDFPRFFEEEPTSWIYKPNQYFEYYKIPDNEKLMMTSFHMDGEALV